MARNFAKKIKALKPSLITEGQLEYEVRFFSIDEIKFEKLKNTLPEILKLPKATSTIQIDEFFEPSSLKLKTDIEINKFDKLRLENGKYFVLKRNLVSEKDKERNIKYSLSLELIIETEIKGTPSLTRVKERWSYTVPNMKFDITEVKDKNGEISREFEIEFDGRFLKSEKFIEDLERKVFFFADMLKPESVYSFVNNKLSMGENNDNDEISSIYISKPRDANTRDINRYLLNNYTVSIKADGLNYFLVFLEGARLVFPNKEDIFLTIEYDKRLERSIFIGEYIEKLSLFLVYDVICFDGTSVIEKNYFERRKYFGENFILRKNQVKILGVELKEVIVIKTFYEEMKEILQKMETLKYDNDGLILTPISSPFLTDGQGKKNRVIGEYDDVLKIKPLEKMTIDFLVSDGKLYIYDGKMVEFDTIGMKDIFRYEIQNDYEDNTVVEFAPTIVREKKHIGNITINKKYYLYKDFKVREDKKFPNNRTQVMAIMELLRDPITYETLRGEDTRLMRFHINNIKRELYKAETRKSFIVDIGAGNGSDLNRNWNHASCVLAIEPEAYEGLLERLEDSDVKEKVVALKCKGEDTLLIRERFESMLKKIALIPSKLVIVFMISLTFFWKNEETLKALSNTILMLQEVYNQYKPDGKVRLLYYTVVGDKIEKYLLEKGDVNLNGIELSLKGKEVKIKIKDSLLVEEQSEYLVNVSELFGLCGFEKRSININKFEMDLMSENEMIYNSFFDYGVGEYTGKFNFKLRDCLKEGEKEEIELRNGKSLYRIGVKGHREVDCYAFLLDSNYRIFGNIDDFDASILRKYTIMFLQDDILSISNSGNAGIVVLHRCKNGFEPVVKIRKDEMFFILNEDDI